MHPSSVHSIVPDCQVGKPRVRGTPRLGYAWQCSGAAREEMGGCRPVCTLTRCWGGRSTKSHVTRHIVSAMPTGTFQPSPSPLHAPPAAGTGPHGAPEWGHSVVEWGKVAASGQLQGTPVWIGKEPRKLPAGCPPRPQPTGPPGTWAERRGGFLAGEVPILVPLMWATALGKLFPAQPELW